MDKSAVANYKSCFMKASSGVISPLFAVLRFLPLPKHILWIDAL